MAGRCDAAARAERRRDGRRAHVRELRRPARRHLHRRHDRRLGTPPLRTLGEGQQRDHQQGPRREPRSLRHLLQAAGHHRVGIIIPL